MNTDFISEAEYGDVWAKPAETLGEIARSCADQDEIFKKALSMGCFSQYTSYRQSDVVARLVDWEISVLEKWIGADLSGLPKELDELAILPEVLLVQRHKRMLSPDLLRNLYYALFLQHQMSLSAEDKLSNILEIGSGFGSFARIMKTYHRSACVWLVDLPESLNIAYIYLKTACPHSIISLIDSPDAVLSDSVKHDFILVSVNESARLFGKNFDLAVNIWSLGEMPNSWIKYWFDLLQTHCKVDRLYSLNAFASPVTVKSKERAKQGDWLFQLNGNWDVKYFEIDPEIHRCTFIRKFYTGLSLYCQRIESGTELNRIMKIAETDSENVLLEDWVVILINQAMLENYDKPEIDIASSKQTKSAYEQLSVLKLLAITEHIGYPRIESKLDSTFYRLWNDYRLNADPLKGGLLLAYLAMTFKSEPNHRCTKEEIFLLNRLPAGLYHKEYHDIRLLDL